MERPFDGRAILKDLLESPHRRVRYYEQADQSLIETISLGILFVMAWWSGPALKAFAKLKEVLNAVDPAGRLELVIVDTDGCPDLYTLPEFRDKLAGGGEAAWVKEGRITFTSGLGYRPECFEPRTRELLARGGDLADA